MSQMSKLLRAARESVEAGEQLPVEDIAAGMDDTSLTVDVIDEVQAPVQDLDAGLVDVDAAEGEAVALDVTATQLNDTLEEGGQGADPLAADFVSDQIQEAVERFGLGTTGKRASKEAFATSAGRREVTRGLAKEAADTAASLRERATAAIKKAIEWLKGMVASAMSQAVRLQKRAKALEATARGSKVSGGKDLKMNGAFLGGKDPVETARALLSLNKSLPALANAVTSGEGATKDAIDLNPGQVGGVTLRVEFGDKASFVREAGTGEAVQLKSLDSATATNVAKFVGDSVAALVAAKASFDSMTKNSLSLIGALKTDGAPAERAAAVSSVTAVTRGAGAVVSLGLSTGSRLLDYVDASLKAKEATAPAGAAAA